MRGDQGGAQIAAKLNLLIGRQQHLLEVSQQGIIATARQILIEAFERSLLLLQLLLPRVELLKAGLGFACRIASLLGRTAAFDIDCSQPAPQIRLQDFHLLVAVIPLHGQQQYRRRRNHDRRLYGAASRRCTGRRAFVQWSRLVGIRCVRIHGSDCKQWPSRCKQLSTFVMLTPARKPAGEPGEQTLVALRGEANLPAAGVTRGGLNPRMRYK